MTTSSVALDGVAWQRAILLAYDDHLRCDIAVKIVHRGRIDDLARFRGEAEVLAPLAHEHILPLYDFGQDGLWHYLVMPYISHGTRADLLHTHGPLTMEEAARDEANLKSWLPGGNASGFPV